MRICIQSVMLSALLCCALPVDGLAENWGGQDWVRIDSGNIELYSNAGARPAQRAMDRLNELREALPLEGAADGSPTQVPLRLIVLKSRGQLRNFTSEKATTGFFQTGLDRDYIITWADEGISQIVAHEFVHYLTARAGGRTLSELAVRPLWLEEGTAEFYSTANAEDQGELWVGKPIPSHLQLLKDSDNWLTAEQLLESRPDGHEVRDAYYAETWALVHMLSQDPRFTGGMDQFISALDAGADEAEAFTQSFGMTFAEALEQTREYIDKLRAQPTPFVRNAMPSQTEVTEVEEVDSLDGLLMLGETALACHRLETAEDIFAAAAEEAPEDPRVLTGEARLAEARGDSERARKLLTQALDQGLHDAQAYFTLAMIEQTDGAPEQRVNQLLEQTVGENPNFAEAHVLLGVRATDSGDLTSAVEHLRTAAQLLPDASHVWYSLAFAEQRRGDFAAARRAALRAVRTGTTPAEKGMASALLGSLR